MAGNAKPDRGMVELNSEECKGCGLCVEACPPKVLQLADRLNRYGYHPAVYAGRGLHRLRHLLLRLSGAGRASRCCRRRRRRRQPCRNN